MTNHRFVIENPNKPNRQRRRGIFKHRLHDDQLSNRQRRRGTPGAFGNCIPCAFR